MNTRGLWREVSSPRSESRQLRRLLAWSPSEAFDASLKTAELYSKSRYRATTPMLLRDSSAVLQIASGQQKSLVLVQVCRAWSLLPRGLRPWTKTMLEKPCQCSNTYCQRNVTSYSIVGLSTSGFKTLKFACMW